MRETAEVSACVSHVAKQPRLPSTVLAAVLCGREGRLAVSLDRERNGSRHTVLLFPSGDVASLQCSSSASPQSRPRPPAAFQLRDAPCTPIQSPMRRLSRSTLHTRFQAPVQSSTATIGPSAAGRPLVCRLPLGVHPCSAARQRACEQGRRCQVVGRRRVRLRHARPRPPARAARGPAEVVGTGCAAAEDYRERVWGAGHGRRFPGRGKEQRRAREGIPAGLGGGAGA